jgi:hypothetical protein
MTVRADDVDYGRNGTVHYMIANFFLIADQNKLYTRII